MAHFTTTPDHTNVRYAPHMATTLNVFKQSVNKIATGNPCIIFFNGGLWGAGNKTDLNTAGSLTGGKALLSYCFDEYNREGYATDEPVNFVGVDYQMVNYESSDPTRSTHYPAYWPSIWESAGRAIQHVKDNATLYEIDPLKIIVMGFSAGGTLALWHGFSPSWPYQSKNDISTHKYSYRSDSQVVGCINYDGQIQLDNTHFVWTQPDGGPPGLGARFQYTPFGFMGRAVGAHPTENPLTGTLWTGLSSDISDAASPLALVNSQGSSFTGQGVYSVYDNVGEEPTGGAPPTPNGWTDLHSKGQGTMLKTALDAKQVKDNVKVIITAASWVDVSSTDNSAPDADETSEEISSAVYQWARKRWGFTT